MTILHRAGGKIIVSRCTRGGFYDEWSAPTIMWAANGRLCVKGEENADTNDLRSEVEHLRSYFEDNGRLPDAPALKAVKAVSRDQNLADLREYGRESLENALFKALCQWD